MNALLIALSIPIFFLSIGLEMGLSRWAGKQRYQFEDSVTNLSCGIGQQVLGFFFQAVTVGGYVLVYERYRVTTVPDGPLAWVLLFLGVDLAYYAFHRASHRINVIWAGHVVHHQSEEYNLAVALRQSWFVKLFEWAFYLPLALLGLSPIAFLTVTTLNTLYQFWIHTRAVGELGPLEWVLNTPSHHRVHHGINPKYIDKNYAGVLIVWDRLFGTFKEEDEEPAYGTVKPLASYNPLWANVEQWVAIAKLSAASPRLIDKLWAWFAPPEWRPRELGGKVTIPETSREEQVRYAVRATPGVRAYVAVEFTLVAGVTGALLLLAPKLPVSWVAAIAGLVVLTLVSWGGLFERRRWVVPFEVGRLTLVGLAVAVAVWQRAA